MLMFIPKSSMTLKFMAMQKIMIHPRKKEQSYYAYVYSEIQYDMEVYGHAKLPYLKKKKKKKNRNKLNKAEH